MSRLKKEVARTMTDLAGSEGTLTARFRFSGDFIGFQGHFPAKKILPGICQIQCVLSMLERHGRKPVDLKEIVTSKFFTPVLPDEEISCACRDMQEGAVDFTVKAVLTRGEQKVSEMKLRVCYRARGA